MVSFLPVNGPSGGLTDLHLEVLDDGVGEELLRHDSDLPGGLLLVCSVELEADDLAHAHVLDAGEAYGVEGSEDGFALGVEDGLLQGDPVKSR